MFWWLFAQPNSEFLVYGGKQVYPKMSVFLPKMVRILLSDLVMVKGNVETDIVNDVGNTVDIVLHLFFIEDHLQSWILMRNSLDCQFAIYPYESPRRTHILWNVQRNHRVVIHQKLLSDCQVAIDSMVEIFLTFLFFEEIGFDSFMKMLKHDIIRMIKGVVLLHSYTWSVISDIFLGSNSDDLLAPLKSILKMQKIAFR